MPGDSSIADTKLLYPLNARKFVIKGRDIEQFADYEGPLPLESTEILEFPCWLEFPREWGAIEGQKLIDGVSRVIGPRKTPFVVLRVKARLDYIARVADMTAQFAEILRNADRLLSEFEQRDIRLLGLRLKVTVWLYEVARNDPKFMKKFEQFLEQNYGPKIAGKIVNEEAHGGRWIRVSTIRQTEVTMEIEWHHYDDSGNEYMYEREFDCGKTREQFEKRKEDAESPDEWEEHE
ncbi:hypothetical protein M3Y99_01120200 [Aphelenchoides fujianensis]|nr:hypothetical protein M3Y99_01120200 [Aphelenchoides fujianensis]